MHFRRAAYIFNPVAGGRSRPASAGATRDRMLCEVPAVDLWTTESPDHATDLARRASVEGYDLLVVQGGDGTVNEAVQGLAGQVSPPLLVLPGGTANVLVNEVGLPRDAFGVIASLPTLVAKPVRLGKVTFRDERSRFFLLMCGAGLDAEIAAVTTSDLKNRLGLGAFWFRGSRRILQRFPRLRVAGDGSGRPPGGASSLVVVSKSRTYGGGLVLTPEANLFADRLAVADFTGTSRARYGGYLVAAVLAMTGWWPGIRHGMCETIRIEPYDDSTVYVQVDGEVAGSLPAQVTLASETLRLLIPPGYGSAWLDEAAAQGSTSLAVSPQGSLRRSLHQGRTGSRFSPSSKGRFHGPGDGAGTGGTAPSLHHRAANHIARGFGVYSRARAESCCPDV